MTQPTLILVTIGDTARLIAYANPEVARREVEDFNTWVRFSQDDAQARIITPEEREEPLIDTLLSTEEYVAALEQHGYVRAGGGWYAPTPLRDGPQANPDLGQMRGPLTLRAATQDAETKLGESLL